MDCFVEFQYLLLSKNWQKKKHFFLQIKKSNVIVRLPKHKATTHVPFKKALLNASHIMSNSNERENEKKEDVVPSCYVENLSWNSLVDDE